MSKQVLPVMQKINRDLPVAMAQTDTSCPKAYCHDVLLLATRHQTSDRDHDLKLNFKRAACSPAQLQRSANLVDPKHN